MYTLKDVLLDDFLRQNNKRIGQMKESIQNEQLCFILGAGVSQSKGFPNWQTLLSKMIGKLLYLYNGNENAYPSVRKLYEAAISEEEEKFMDGCAGKHTEKLDKINLLELAEYLLNYHTDSLTHHNGQIRRGIAEKQMASLVRACLYDNPDACADKLTTLDAITRVIISRYKQNESRQDVITYNYDDLLEKSLQSQPECKDWEDHDFIKSIAYTDPDKKLEDKKINICHIHGKVSRTDNDQDSEQLILSESSYHDIETADYKWIHTVQANAMINSTCIFVGFSAEDYNFRRIVRKNEKTEQNFIFFAINDFVNAVFGKIVQETHTSSGKSKGDIYKEIFSCPDKYKYEKLMLAFLVESKMKYWEKQNIQPIWTTLDELPGIILGLMAENQP